MRGDCFSVGADGNHNEFQGELDEHNLSGRAGLDWHPDKNTLLYGSFSRGFKAGGFPVLNACCQYQFTPTKQEELNASEIGAKFTLMDRQLQSNFAFFYYDYKDKQLLTKQKDPVFGPLPVLRNAPRSHVYGAETDLQMRPADGLFIALSGAYVRTQIDEFVSTNDAGDTQDFAGKPFNFSPRSEVNLVTDYTFPIGNWAAGIGADVQRSGKTNGTLAQTPAYDMPAYTLVGSRIHLESPNRRWSGAIFGRNLSNAFYSTAAFNIGDAISRMTGPPRTFGLTLGYNLE
jgi:outer membrane receptor protein involved in Fe transport